MFARGDRQVTWADRQIVLPSGAVGEIDVSCPQCSASRKKKQARCLSVNTAKGTWLCHHCAWRGSLCSGEEGRSDVTWAGPRSYRKPIWIETEPTDEMYAWFATRAISRAVVDRNRITSGVVYMPQTEDREEVIQFPYLRQGEVVNVKYRVMREKFFRLSPGAERVLYGLDDLREQTAGVIVEGEVDKLSVEEAGIQACVSVPDGAPTPGSGDLAKKLDYLEKAGNCLDPLTKIVLAVDADAPGQALQAELIRRLGAERCWTVRWPDGCKDANDVLRAHGAAVLAQVLTEAVPVALPGIVEAADTLEDVLEYHAHGLPGGVSTGWPTLDTYYTVRPGELTVVTGYPSSGKSNWLDALCVQLMRRHEWRIAFCSPENYPIQRHVAGLCEKVSGMPFREWRVGHPMMERRDVVQAVRYLQDHARFLFVDDDGLSVEGVLRQSRAVVARFGVRGLVVDPWNELDHTRPERLTETEYISEALTKFRRFARAHGVHVWLVAHPAKPQLPKGEHTYPVPTPYAISGSAAWRNKADNCVTIHRNPSGDMPERVWVHVQKIRFREVGRPGVVELKWNWRTGGYVSPDEEGS